MVCTPRPTGSGRRTSGSSDPVGSAATVGLRSRRPEHRAPPHQAVAIRARWWAPADHRSGPSRSSNREGRGAGGAKFGRRISRDVSCARPGPTRVPPPDSGSNDPVGVRCNCRLRSRPQNIGHRAAVGLHGRRWWRRQMDRRGRRVGSREGCGAGGAVRAPHRSASPLMVCTPRPTRRSGRRDSGSK